MDVKTEMELQKGKNMLALKILQWPNQTFQMTGLKPF